MRVPDSFPRTKMNQSEEKNIFKVDKLVIPREKINRKLYLKWSQLVILGEGLANHLMRYSFHIVANLS